MPRISSVVVVVLFMTIIGIGTYYAIRIKAGGEYSLNHYQQNMAENNLMIVIGIWYGW